RLERHEPSTFPIGWAAFSRFPLYAIRVSFQTGHASWHSQGGDPMSNAVPASDTYQLGHHPSVVARHARRTAEMVAAFFLPFLKRGMRVLDVGWGPGSIPSGFARRVAPGETIGIDLSADVIATARSLAGETAARNLSFEVGNVYEPRFAAGTFDAV